MRPSSMLWVALLVGGAINVGCAPVTVPEASRPGAVELALEGRPVQNLSSQSQGRRACGSIMVLPGESSSLNDEIVSDLEGHLIQRGLHVVSAAITGRVVSDDPQKGDVRGQRVEGASQLSKLERALILADRANAECVFQVLKLEFASSQVSRFYLWPPGTKQMTEVDRPAYEQAPPRRRWVIFGPQLRVDGKLIETKTGAVLSVIGLQSATPFSAPSRKIALAEVGGHLLLQSNHFGWRLDSGEDRERLRSTVMSELTRTIGGTVKSAE